MGVDYWAKANAQQGPQPPDVAHAVQRVTDFMLSADGHAAGQLATAIIMSPAMILLLPPAAPSPAHPRRAAQTQAASISRIRVRVEDAA